MNHVLNAWVLGADPLTFLDMGRHLEACRRRYEADPGLFSRYITEQLVDNPHRLTTLLIPDKACQARVDAAFAGRMAAERARRTEAEMQQLADEATAIEDEAGTPNSPETLALLPQLKVSDLPAKPRHIPTTVYKFQISDSKSQAGEVPLLRNDVFSNGVNYLQFSLALDGLPDELWPFLPHYSDAITKLGAAGMNYETMAQRVAAATGGISCSPSFQHHATSPDKPVLAMRFACKALDSQIDQALDVLRDLVFTVDPRDRERLRATVNAKSDDRESAVPVSP